MCARSSPCHLPPTRLASKVDDRRPEGGVSIPSIHECATLATYTGASEPPKSAVEGHSGRDGKSEVGLIGGLGIIAVVADPVRCLGPPVVAFKTKPLDWTRDVLSVTLTLLPNVGTMYFVLSARGRSECSHTDSQAPLILTM